MPADIGQGGGKEHDDDIGEDAVGAGPADIGGQHQNGRDETEGHDCHIARIRIVFQGNLRHLVHIVRPAVFPAEVTYHAARNEKWLHETYEQNSPCKLYRKAGKKSTIPRRIVNFAACLTERIGV